MSFEKLYPQLTSWVESRGWIEIGDDGNSSSWLRILDEGGLVWESDDDKSIDQALSEAEKFLKENYGD